MRSPAESVRYSFSNCGTDAEEDEYPFPDADDRILGEFLGAWRRTLVRSVHFLGPAIPELTLTKKEGGPKLPNLQDHVSLSGMPSAILLFRQDSYEYACTARKESLMLISNLLSYAPQLMLESCEGDSSWMNMSNDGPPPPEPGRDGGCINVRNTVTRLPGCWDDPAQYSAGLFGGGDTVVQIPVTRWDVAAYQADVVSLVDVCEMFETS